MANVNFKRGNNATMNATDITDGLIFLNTEDRQIYFDNGTERLQYGGDTTLVSDTSSASDDTAFTSNATVNIFTQQDTIVDSKANALAVTQNHIPLGCLAFSETIGTEDFSSIGDGTVSGALVDLNSRLSELNQNLTKINPTTKTLWGYINGQWVDLRIRAYYDSIPVFVGGNFGIEVENGNYVYSTNYTKRAFQIANNLIKEPSIAPSYCDSIVSKEEIDFSAYTQIVVKNSFQNLICNVSGYNGRGYLYVDFLRDSANGYYLHVGIASQKENFGTNTIDNLVAYCLPTANTIEISEITIE